MALKAFAMWSVFPLIRETLHGVCASSPWEARLGREEFGREVHSFAAAFKESDVRELLEISNHLVFNSFAQLERFRPLWEKERGRVSVGLRVNPEHSEGHTAIYDPCAPMSRLGIRAGRNSRGDRLSGVEGLHFHTLCEQLFEPLERTARVFEEKFGEFLPGMKWLNLGGGHHITREGYDIDGLVELIKYFRGKYGLEVYLEPGEAIAIGTGILVGEVLDVVHNEMDIAILDVSATCHMPDFWRCPTVRVSTAVSTPAKRPTPIASPAVLPGRGRHRRLVLRAAAVARRPAGLPGHGPLHHGEDHHLQRHPAPGHLHLEPETGELKVVRSFGYEDFKSRLS